MYFKPDSSTPIDARRECSDCENVLPDQADQTLLREVIAELKQTGESLRLNEARLDSLLRISRHKDTTVKKPDCDVKDIDAPGVSRDISGLMRLESALRESEQQFRTLTENSPNVIIQYDRECRRIYVNPTYIQVFGIPADLAQNVTLDTQWLTTMNITAEAYMAKLQRVMQTGTPAEILLEWTRQDTKQFTSHLIHVVAEKAPSGGITGCIAIGHNITRLKEAEFRLAKLAETSPGVMFNFLLKPDGTSCMPYISPRIEELNGLRPEDMAENMSEANARIHPDDISRVLKSIDNSARTLSTWHIEYRILHPDKGEVWIEGCSTPESQPDGGIQWYGFFHDITERKTTEKLLYEKREQLAAMSMELSLAEERERRRIASVLHDHIGQILLLCKMKLGTLDNAFEGSSDEDTYHEIQALLAQTIDDVRSLTQQLNPPLLASVGLEAALEWLAKKMEADYSLRVDYTDDGSIKPLSEEHRSVVFQSARELLINVAKHSGTSEARLSIGREEDLLVLMVEDKGDGFACVPDPATNMPLDSSFGLFNIRQRIKHLVGAMSIESAPGRGTCAIIRVPLADG